MVASSIKNTAVNINRHTSLLHVNCVWADNITVAKNKLTGHCSWRLTMIQVWLQPVILSEFASLFRVFPVYSWSQLAQSSVTLVLLPVFIPRCLSPVSRFLALPLIVLSCAPLPQCINSHTSYSSSFVFLGSLCVGFQSRFLSCCFCHSLYQSCPCGFLVTSYVFLLHLPCLFVQPPSVLLLVPLIGCLWFC